MKTLWSSASGDAAAVLPNVGRTLRLRLGADYSCPISMLEAKALSEALRKWVGEAQVAEYEEKRREEEERRVANFALIWDGIRKRRPALTACDYDAATEPNDNYWRKNGDVMTFRRLFAEAAEACSPALFFWRQEAVNALADARLEGAHRRFRRHLECLFVQGYLRERRLGLPHRRPGVPGFSY